MSIEHFIAEFLAYMVTMGSSPHTIYHYRDSLKLFSEFLGPLEVQNLKLEHVYQFTRWLRRRNGGKYCQNSIHAKLTDVRCFLKWLNSYKKLTFNYEDVMVPKPGGRRLNYFTAEEVGRIRRAINENRDTGLRMRAIFELLISSGIRRGELLSLQKRDVDLKHQEAVVRGKGGKYATIYFSKEAAHWIEKYLASRDDKHPALWVAYYRGEIHSLSSTPLRTQLDRLGRKARINKKVHPHAFRHTVATHLMRKSKDIELVRGVLRHTNISSTQIYLHYSNDQIRNAHKLIKL